MIFPIYPLSKIMSMSDTMMIGEKEGGFWAVGLADSGLTGLKSRPVQMTDRTALLNTRIVKIWLRCKFCLKVAVTDDNLYVTQLVMLNCFYGFKIFICLQLVWKICHATKTKLPPQFGGHCSLPLIHTNWTNSKRCICLMFCSRIETPWDSQNSPAHPMF